MLPALPRKSLRRNRFPTYRLLIAVTATAAAFSCAGLVPGRAEAASSVMIQFTGLDLVYDGSSLSTAGADPLDSVSFAADGGLLGDGPLWTEIDIDVSLPGVGPLPLAGGSVATTGGSLDLGLPGGDGLTLDLAPGRVLFLDFGVVEFAFAGTVAQVTSQSLPGGLVLGSDVSFTLSSQVVPGSLTTGLDGVAGFRSAGTGEIMGSSAPVVEVTPEASTFLAFVVLGGVGLFCFRAKPAAA